MMTRVELVNRFQKAKDFLGDKCKFTVTAVMSLDPIYAEAVVSELEAQVAKIILAARDDMRQKSVLTVGRQCFYHGTIYTIIHELGDSWIIHEDDKLQCCLCSKKDVEPLIDEILLIHDEVLTVDQKQGYVVGYEEDLNRVLIQLDATSRVRYSYGLDELISL